MKTMKDLVQKVLQQSPATQGWVSTETGMINSLSTIPLELRHTIYDQLLEAGDISILRTSKTVHNEAKARIPELASIA